MRKWIWTGLALGLAWAGPAAAQLPACLLGTVSAAPTCLLGVNVLVGGGGGGGDATAANQVIQITAEQAVQANTAPTAVGSTPSNTNDIGTWQSGTLQHLISCDKHNFVHVTSATDTLLVQGVASQFVYICGVKASFSGSAAQTVSTEDTASVNANCSSTKVQTGPAIVGNASSPSSDGFYGAMWGGAKNSGTAGRGWCANSTGTGGVDIEFWYTQAP